jgi:hypothetical protein
MMAKSGRVPSESPIDQDLPGRVGKVVISTNHLGNTHEMVINHTGKVVRSHSVGADDDEIANSLGIEVHFSVDEIFKSDRPPFHSKAKDRTVSFRFHPGDLVFGQGTASAVIAGHLSFGKLILPDNLQSFRGAEAFVDFSFLKKLIRVVTVERKTLRLAVGAIGTFPVRTFVPLDSQPMKIFNDAIEGGLRRSLQIRILDPEDEGALMFSGKEVIVQSCSGISDVEKPGGSRSKTNSYIRSSHSKPLVNIVVDVTQTARDYFEIPNPNLQIPAFAEAASRRQAKQFPNPNVQITETGLFISISNFGHWDLFGTCCLVIGAYGPSSTRATA